MYQHTQLGTAIVVGLVLALIFTLWFGVKTLWHPISTILLAVLVSLLPLFYSLTVEVTQDAIHCSFGIGVNYSHPLTLRCELPTQQTAKQ